MSKKKTAKEWLKNNWKWLAASVGAITLGAIKVVLDSSSDNTDEGSDYFEEQEGLQDIAHEPGTKYWNKQSSNWEVDGKPYTYSVSYTDRRDGEFHEKTYSDVDNGYEDYQYYDKQWWSKDTQWDHVPPEDE